jgi:hypothetical protein
MRDGRHTPAPLGVAKRPAAEAEKDVLSQTGSSSRSNLARIVMPPFKAPKDPHTHNP